MIKNSDEKILLLSCCAPCACAVIKRMSEEGLNFAVVFYNPNIHPYEEYIKRRDEQKMLCYKWGIEFIELEYNVKDWIEATKEYKDEPERGKRCSICFEFRLKKVMEYAKELGVNKVASVLGVSRWKDLNQVNEAGKKASDDSGVEYVLIEGRKGGMQELRLQLIKELELYNQEYCGCIYSMRK